MQFTFRPIEQWPRPLTKVRERSQFSSTYKQTTDLLERELNHLRARNAVLQVALQEADIRRDGLPRANSRPAHPGVILAFETPTGALSMPCDKFTDWESNLRAIALSLEALRKVDRYGVTQSGEQYKGWNALPEPGSDSTLRTKADAVRFLAQISGESVEPLVHDREAQQRAYRIAARKLHPDNGGNHDGFTKLQQAMEILKGAR